MIGVLVSGQGSNLQALIDQALPIAAVASNVAAAGAVSRAAAVGIPAAVYPLEDYGSREERDLAMAAWLEEQGAELIVCAGYMQLLTPAFLERHTAINVHPSLLPEFPGDDAHRGRPGGRRGSDGRDGPLRRRGGRLRAGHLSGAGSDPPGDTAETLRERVHEVEHRLLPEAARLYLAGALRS